MVRLFHVSEDGAIARFEPKAPGAESGVAYPVVWAVDEPHLPNYLLPRDCPRVTFDAGGGATPDDVRRLVGPCRAGRVVAIEAAWFERACTTRLYVYHLPEEGFHLLDAPAGYYVSPGAVTPSAVRRIDRPVAELLRHNVELRVVPSLWPLVDAVAASTLPFSIIRMRNASPRP